MRIQRLSDTVIDQIAAGEVIERPASVIKELIENSLDAGARRIDIAVEGGGMEAITVIDNGEGISQSDLPLAVERHATSKITDASDLQSLLTYGFRGEALSSIASVAELELKSRRPEELSGYRLCVRYGQLEGDIEPVGMAGGTVVTVRKLFERVPARSKFLRSPSTEFSHISRMVKELALGAPQAGFTLTHQGKRVVQYHLENRKGRFEEVLRPTFEPIVVQEAQEGITLEAYLSPAEATTERAELFLYINGRLVKNRGLLAAIRNAYLLELGPRHEPTGTVYLDIRPEWIDPNVHPQKLEVRCAKQETLYGWLQSVLRKKAQAGRPLAPAPRVGLAPTGGERPRAFQLHYLGEWRGYWVCDEPDALVLVDKEAVLIDTRVADLEGQWKKGGIPSDRLAQILFLKASEDLSGAVEQHQAFLLKLGFEAEDHGGGDLLIQRIPQGLAPEVAGLVLKQVVALLAQGTATLDDVLPLIARHFPTPSVDPLTALRLWQNRHLEGGTRGRGRRALFRLPFREIAQYFEQGAPT